METLMDYMIKGGSLMWVLLGFSVFGLAVILDRLVVYLSYGFGPDEWLKRVLAEIEAGRVDQALAMARKNRHPVARVVEVYLENLGRPAKVRVDNVKREGALVLERVEKRLRILAAISHLAPLVGLLGTVTGMVVAFARIESIDGAPKPSDLAGGLWEALLTTVFGLVVAIRSTSAPRSHSRRFLAAGTGAGTGSRENRTVSTPGSMLSAITKYALCQGPFW
jgi:biopolymer transport protein ExbB